MPTAGRRSEWVSIPSTGRRQRDDSGKNRRRRDRHQHRRDSPGEQERGGSDCRSPTCTIVRAPQAERDRQRHEQPRSPQRSDPGDHPRDLQPRDRIEPEIDPAMMRNADVRQNRLRLGERLRRSRPELVKGIRHDRQHQRERQAADADRLAQLPLAQKLHEEAGREKCARQQVRRVYRHADADRDCGQPRPVVREQRRRREQEDAEHRRLQHRSQHILPGDARLRIPRIILIEQPIRQPASRGRMNERQQKQKTTPQHRAISTPTIRTNTR